MKKTLKPVLFDSTLLETLMKFNELSKHGVKNI